MVTSLITKGKIFLLFTAILLICIKFLFNFSVEKPKPAKAVLTQSTLVNRGRYLVDIMGCGDCHSPKHMTLNGPVIDTENMLSGFKSQNPLPDRAMEELKDGQIVSNFDVTATSGPWGTTFAANITSDETGIGTWSEAQFKNALTKGKYKGLDGGRQLLPTMPWQNFSKLTDQDVKAIFYYLKSTKPWHNIVPEHRQHR